MLLKIVQNWEGQALSEADEVRVSLVPQDEALVIEVDAPFYADPAPKGPPGSTWALWEHEVVEVFLMGQGESYTVVELGPHGHHLVLRLLGRRNIVERELPIEFEAHVEGDRWKGRARVPNSCLPDPILRLNAYAIHGTGAGRVYAAWAPVPGPVPDFHRLECFPEVGLGQS